MALRSLIDPEDLVRLGAALRARTTNLFEGIFEPAPRPADAPAPPAAAPEPAPAERTTTPEAAPREEGAREPATGEPPPASPRIGAGTGPTASS